MTITLIHGDTLTILGDPALARHADGKMIKADACISDPPYGIDFAGDSTWDSFGDTFDRKSPSGANRAYEQWCGRWARLLWLDILWPGAHVAGFSGYTSAHRLASGIENAGFEIRTPAAWLHMKGQLRNHHNLMPVFEPIVIARKPASGESYEQMFRDKGRGMLHTDSIRGEERCPVNVEIADPEVLNPDNYDDEIDQRIAKAAKFFYVSKANTKDREYGLDGFETQTIEGSADNNMRGAKEGAKSKNPHPTVKPIDLMRRLVRLLTRPGHTVIDPFMGSGTTGVAAVLEGRNFIGIEREEKFFRIASARIEFARTQFEQGKA
jgi:DNA modification methylase